MTTEVNLKLVEDLSLTTVELVEDSSQDSYIIATLDQARLKD